MGTRLMAAATALLVAWCSWASRAAALPGALLDPPQATAESITPAEYLAAVQEEQRGEACLSALDEAAQKSGFEMPQKWLNSFTGETGKLYIMGDGLVDELCSRGKPGLCCSSSHPCDGKPPYGHGKRWQKALEETPKHLAKGWQSLTEYKMRSRKNKATGTAYVMIPAVGEADEVPASIFLLKKFLKESHAAPEDVLVLGMLGGQFDSEQRWPVLEKYTWRLMLDVVNNFPGRVVLLSASPRHFDRADPSTGCRPSPYPGADLPDDETKHAIYVYNVWKHIANRRSWFVDVFDMLRPLWHCHREGPAKADRCTRWSDAVISLQVHLVLRALEKIVEAEEDANATGKELKPSLRLR